MNVRRPPCSCTRSSSCSARAEHRLELVLVERDAEVVDAGDPPVARLDDDVHRAALELRQAQLEPLLVELAPTRRPARRRRASSPIRP